MQWCSMDDVMMCFPLFLLAYAMPFMTVLFASVALPVKISSSGCAFMSFATVFLESSSVCFAFLPCLCSDIVFAYSSLK